MRIFFLRILGKTVYSSQFAPLLDNCADPFVVDTEYYWVARSKFGTNDWGAWTDDTHFTVVAHVGGGANSSAFDEFFDSLPSHDDVYGACKFLGFDSGVSENATGDGLPCLWSWVKYIFFPQLASSFDIIGDLFDVIKSKWPLYYVTQLVESVKMGLVTDPVCPIPEVESFTMYSVSVPGFTLCDSFTELAGVVDNDSVSYSIFVIAVYVMLAVGLMEVGLRFLL